MATLTNTKIKDTYDGLLKTTDNDVIGTTEKVITDGLGNASILSIGTQSASFSEDIEINGHTIGRGSGGIGTNVVLGTGTLTSNTTGNSNVAIGFNSSFFNTTGIRNISIGTEVLVNNSTGNANIALGFNSLYHITGSDNIAIGRAAGQYSTGTLNKTAGDQNVYIGANIVSGAQDTDNEIVIGYATTGNGSNTATYGNTSITDHYFDGNVRADFFYGDGSNLTNLPVSATPTLEDVVTSAVGANTSSINLVIAGANLGTITNDSNTLFGENALASNTGGSYNTAIGWEALTSFTFGSDNTAIGSQALHNLNTGANNTAIGTSALSGGTSLNSNTAIGHRALLSVSGDSNVALGHRAGELRNGGVAKSAGDNNVYIGSNTISALSDTDNEIVIGANAVGNGSNSATYGDSNITKHIFTGGSVGIGTSSPTSKLTIGTGTFSAAGTGTTGIYTDATNGLTILSDAMTVNTRGGTERLRIDSSGNVGIGESDPSGYWGQAYNLVLSDGNAGLTIKSATTGNGRIVFTDTKSTTAGLSDGGMIHYNHNSDSMQLHANGAERMRIDSSGRVGIGTSSPDANAKIDVYGGRTYLDATNEFTIRLSNTGTVGGFIGTPASGALGFYSSTGSERMRIDSSGKVGIGTSSFGTFDMAKIAGSNSVANDLTLYGPNTSQVRINFSDPESNGVGEIGYNHSTNAMRFVTSGSEKVVIDSSGNVGIGESNPANNKLVIKDSGDVGIQITKSGVVSGTVKAVSTGLAFGVDTGSGNTERMRITSGGFLKASDNGSYLGSANTYHEFNNSSTEWTQVNTTTNSVGQGLLIRMNSSTGSTNFLAGYSTNISAYRFKIYGDGDIENANNSYGVLSDAKLKENIVDATPKLDELMQVKIRNYNLIGEDLKQIGVVAQELEEVFPAIVYERPDTKEVQVTDEEGNVTTERVETGETTKSVKMSVFVPILIKAMQEQQEIINDLKSRIETLEAK